MKQETTGDELLARVREAAEVPPYTYAGGDSGDDHMGWEMLAARFAGLDAWMCSHDKEPPQEWQR